MIALRGNRVATAEGERSGWWVTIAEGRILDVGREPPAAARPIELGDSDLLPGLIDLHSDCLGERLRPRPTAAQPLAVALLQLDAEAAAYGITTHYVCASFEDDPVQHRSTAQAAEIVRGVAAWRAALRVEHRVHLRFELTSEGLPLLEELAREDVVRLLSYMDHSPGRGQFIDESRWRAWYARRFDGDDAALDALLMRRRDRQAQGPQRRRELARIARRMGIALASHDDDGAESVAEAVALGATIAEFPVNAHAAAAASAAGLGVAMGAPNAQRGGSHMAGLSARAALAAGHLDALTSDYHPPSLLGAAYRLAAERVCSWAEAVALVTAGPARLAGLDDRGAIAPGLRADLVAAATVDGEPIVRQAWSAGRPVLGVAHEACAAAPPEPVSGRG